MTLKETETVRWWVIEWENATGSLSERWLGMLKAIKMAIQSEILWVISLVTQMAMGLVRLTARRLGLLSEPLLVRLHQLSHRAHLRLRVRQPHHRNHQHFLQV